MGQSDQRLFTATEKYVELGRDEQFSLLLRLQCPYSFFEIYEKGLSCVARSNSYDPPSGNPPFYQYYQNV